MTRTTVYLGEPDDHEDEPLTDVYHGDNRHSVIVKAGQHEYRIPVHEPVDIYVDGEEVED